MAKKVKAKSREIAARMLLSTTAGNLKLFDEFLKQTNYFRDDPSKTKDVFNLLHSASWHLQSLRKYLGEGTAPSKKAAKKKHVAKK